MKKKYFKLSVLILWASVSFAQQGELWSKVQASDLNLQALQKNIAIEKKQTFQLKLTSFKWDMRKAPLESANTKATKLKMQFPDETGKLIDFWVKEAPVMDAALAKKFPNDKSYIGYGVEDNGLKIRFSVNVLGLHAMIVNKEREVQYISPVSQDRNYYKVYNRRDISAEDNYFECFVESSIGLRKTTLDNDFIYPNDLNLRTYRLALGATGEYSQFQLDLSGIDQSSTTDTEKKEVVLAAMTTAITRINAVYENDMAITLKIVSNNDEVIFLDPVSDPYTNGDVGKMLDENQSACDNIIGTAAYDIGHVFGTSLLGVNGRAYLGVVCDNYSKAGGATTSNIPSGDNFYFDVVAHELGHQFGANHSFNADDASCSGDRNNEAAYEPGSGSTLMAYAGICPGQNVQEHSDLYFHAASIDEMWTYLMGSGANCANETSLANNLYAPLANAGNDFTIPKSTAYKLIGQGSDAYADPITFCWEQLDNEINSVPPRDTDTKGTMYRSLNPSTSNTRYLPQLSVVNGGGLSSKWEVTPSVGRLMNFNLTVRDNNKEAGQIDMDAMVITVSDDAGPFIVTSQNTTDIVWTSGTSENITWDAAGTNANGINTTAVNILLSTDGGKTYPTILVSNTPNDGTQIINVPDVSSPSCKIMVEAVGNLFYALNSNFFSIGEFTTECGTYLATDTPKNIPDNDLEGVISQLTVPVDDVIVDVNVSVNVTHSWIGDVTLILESPEGTSVTLINGACAFSDYDDMVVVFDDEGATVACQNTAPAISGTIKPNEALSNFIDESSIGVWKLRAIDDDPTYVGSLNSWSIELCTSQTLDVDIGELTNFELYPNPSSDVINISFQKDVNEVEMSLYDMLGRKIIEKNFNKPLQYFNESIDLSSYARGIYILRIKNGNHFSSRKVQLQ